MSLWFEGIFVGFSIAVPVSEIGFLCIQETLQGGIRLGIAAGIGAALADMMFGIIVALGLGAAQTWLLQYKIPMSIMGGFFLCYLGIKKFFSRPPKKIRHPAYSDLLKVFASTFFITLTDPETILDFIALFTGLIIDTSTNVDSIQFVAGVFIGSAAWMVAFIEHGHGIF